LNLQANNDMKLIQIFPLFKVWSQQAISHNIYTRQWLQNLRARREEVAVVVSHSQNIRHDIKSLWQLVNDAGQVKCLQQKNGTRNYLFKYHNHLPVYFWDRIQ
jgi:hypothetical protein